MKFNLKIIYKVILTLFIQYPLLLPVYAQNEPLPIERSKEKIFYQGEVYYLHVVKKGQTLYSIARAYNTTTQEIESANTGVSLNPLTNGQIIRIPAKSKSEERVETDQDQVKDDFIYHKVQAKETPYSLHLKYKVAVDDIYKFNKGSEKGLQLGQIIKIPNSRTTGTEKNNLKSDADIIGTYKIKQGDTLYKIAESCNISESDLINANDALRWGLKAGMVIKIPKNGSPHFKSPEPGKQDSSAMVKLPGILMKSCDSIAAIKSFNSVKLAVILPFYAAESFKPDTLMLNDSSDESDARLKSIEFKGSGAVEFYEGILLALDTLKKEGSNISLYVYDDQADTNLTRQIVQKLYSIKPDIVFGPFNSENVKIVSNFCQNTGTLFVPPLMKDDSIVRQNPYAFQTIPSSETEINSSLDFLSQYRGQNIIFVHRPDPVSLNETTQFKILLRKRLSVNTVTDTSVIKEVLMDESMQNNIKSLLKSDHKNIVIIASSQEPDVSNVLTQLYTYGRYFEILVYGLPSWQKFKNVRIDYLHDLQVTLFTPFYIDYNNDFVRSFIQTCRTTLGYEPYKTSLKGTGMNYTYLGYDLAYYFVNIVRIYGQSAILCAGNYKPHLLLSRYAFEKNQNGGCWINGYLNLIQYKKDYSIERVDFSTALAQ